MPRDSSTTKTMHADLPPLCLECGYDLRGTASDVCPECGVRFDAETNRRLTQVPTVRLGHIFAVLLLYPVLSPVLVFMPAALFGFVVGLVVYVMFNHLMFSRVCGAFVVLVCMAWAAGLLARDLARQMQRFKRFQDDFTPSSAEPLRASAYCTWLFFGSLIFSYLYSALLLFLA